MLAGNKARDRLGMIKKTQAGHHGRWIELWSLFYTYAVDNLTADVHSYVSRVAEILGRLWIIDVICGCFGRG